MAQQQQTVLRVQTNIPSGVEFISTTSLSVSSTVGLSYSGSGTESSPFTGTTSGTTWSINMLVSGGTGTFYYDVNMSPYAGSEIDLYTFYNINMFIVKPDGNLSGMGGFNEYGTSDLVGNFKIFDGDRIVIDGGTAIPTGGTFNFYAVPDSTTSLTEIISYDTLDLYTDIPLKINKSFAELQDIGKRNSDYSVGLSLPGSKKNNAFFESYFNVDTNSLYFDVTRRVNIDVLLNDERYFVGYMRLNKVSVLNSKVEYDVTLYSTVADLYGKMGNNLLNELNFNDMDWHFNHYFNVYNVSSTWNYNTLQGTKIVPSLWMYPIVHSGYEYSGATVNQSGGTTNTQTRLYTSTNQISGYTTYSAYLAANGNSAEYRINSPINPLLDNQLKPALNMYALIHLMFKKYGYTIKSNFFETPWFKLLYMYGFYSFDGTKFSYKTPPIQVLPSEGVDILPTQTGSTNLTMYIVKTNSGIPALCDTSITGTVTIRNFGTGTVINTNFTIPPNESSYVINWTAGFTLTGLVTSVGITNNTLAYLPQQANTVVPFTEGTFVDFSLLIDQNIKQIDILSSIAKKFNLVLIPDPEVPNQLIIEPYDYYIGSGVIYDWTDKLSFDKGFTVQPALNFIESELILTDQEDGDEANKTFKDRNKFIYGQNIVYNPTDFKSQTKKIDTIFSPEVIRKWDDNIGIPLGINYASQSSNESSGATETVRWKHTGIKSKPRLLYNNGNLSPFLDTVGESFNFISSFRVNNMYFRIQPSTGINPGPVGPDGNTYALGSLVNPVISHTMPMGNPDDNKINNDSICILFNSEQPDDIGLGIPTFNAYTDQDAYKLFYSNRVNNLYNKNTRFLTGQFNLKLPDVKNLEPNDLIKVQEQYFYVNKLEGFDLTSPELTKVELVQTNDFVRPQPYPTRYFKYVYCNETGGKVFKFRTFFNSEENANGIVYNSPYQEKLGSLRRTYYYWSIFYDYMVGTLGGNVSGITSSYQEAATGDLWAYTMTEITEEEYNDPNYLFWFEDDNNIIFIDRASLGPLLYNTNEYYNAQGIWVLSNQFGTNKAFFNVAVDCTTFSGYCASNGVTISAAPNDTPVSVYTTGITINVTDTGWIKYDTQTETVYRFFGTLGNQDIPDCADCSTIRIAYPFADLGNWTVVDCGNPC
jgi:hypothetical protein